MDTALVVVAGLASLVGTLSLVLLLVRRTRRIALRALVGSFLVFVASVLFGGHLADERARAAGFASAADRRSAEAAGFTDAAAWAASRASALGVEAPASTEPAAIAQTNAALTKETQRREAERKARDVEARRKAEEEAVLHPLGVRYDKATDHRHVAMMDAAMAAMRDRLKDPKSADFRNVFLNSSGGAVVACGEVNSRNGFGGYVGFQPFVASPVGGIAVLASDMKKGEFEKTWKALCS
ncbi:MAG: hypothetical protein LWW93_10075 [Hyphomicrobiales bacterium]|nr:hypothetical protein [Hyphomicrobiales bacterium]